MSWLQKIQDNLVIRTGDGQTFIPKWRNARLQVEYNKSEFEFPEVKGTLVKRKQVKGGRYAVEFYFDGEDVLDQQTAFRISAEDPRPWTLTHPFYGQLRVQPLGLEFDNSELNVVKITGTLVETIPEEYPKGKVPVAARIQQQGAAISIIGAQVFATNVIPTPANINKMQAANLASYTKGSKLIDFNFAAEYINAFNQATAAITNATAQPLAAMRTLQNVINKPAQFANTVRERIAQYREQYDTIRLQVLGTADRIASLTKNDKGIFQSTCAEIISSVAYSASTPQPTDYVRRRDVTDVIELILPLYNRYLEDLDLLQSDNGGSPDSFMPDYDLINNLNDLINFTLANLFDIALNAKQERSLILETDSNAILLAHRFYGLLQDDSTITFFMSTNDMGLSEMLHIRKGRKIIYYI